jgi:hypothetical protein
MWSYNYTEFIASVLYIPVLLVVVDFEYTSIHSILSTNVSEEPMLYHR